ncbi:MAG TPA: sigma-70 family RNA polymerase sigma factor [Pirellulales bacterium]|jgi:RNA polymerase sigma-70 factor (ECF subfamily)
MNGESKKADARTSAAAADTVAEPWNEEKRLLGQLREGNAAAYEILVRQQSGRMLAVARRMLMCESDAHDAVQDAFLSAFKSIKTFTGDSSIGTWLHRIVVNACLMKLRSRNGRSYVSIEDLLPAFDATGHHVRRVSKWTASPDELLARSELCSQVRAIIEGLPDSHRSVLWLRDIEEIDTEHTAEILDISPGAVKVRLHRARQALRALLEPLVCSEPGMLTVHQ